MPCGIPNAYILDITMYKMHVSLCSYYTCIIRILISKTLSGTYEGDVFEMCCYRTLDIVLYIYIYIYIYAHTYLLTYSMVQSPS